MKKALVFMHLAVLLWGFTGVLGRAITLDAPVLVWYRMILTCIIILVIALLRKQSIRISRKSFFQLSLIGILMALHWVAFYGSIKLSNASVALVCLSTASIGVSFMEPLFFKTKFNRSEVFIGLLALAGVYSIYSFQTAFLSGILLGILAAMLSGLFTLLNKQIAHKHPPRVMIFYEMGTGTFFLSLLIPVLLLFKPETQLLPNQINFSNWWVNFPQSFAQPNDWLWLLIMALCCTVWAQSLALIALRTLSSFTSTLSVNMEPVYGIILAIIFFNENAELSVGFYVGMALILLSVLIQTIQVVRQRKPPHSSL